MYVSHRVEIMYFLYFFCDVSSGMETCRYMAYWRGLYGKWVCLWTYMGTPQRRRFLGCIKLITLYYSYIWEPLSR
jgi:hypothetical protein